MSGSNLGGELGAHRRYGIRVNGPHPPVLSTLSEAKTVLKSV
jgi:hypothetical protein